MKPAMLRSVASDVLRAVSRAMTCSRESQIIPEHQSAATPADGLLTDTSVKIAKKTMRCAGRTLGG